MTKTNQHLPVVEFHLPKDMLADLQKMKREFKFTTLDQIIVSALTDYIIAYKKAASDRADSKC